MIKKLLGNDTTAALAAFVLLMCLALLAWVPGCKKKGTSHEPLPPESIWVGTGGVALVCGDEEDRISTCVGKGRVWTCVQEGWAHPRYHCAPKHQQAEQP